MDRDHLIDLFSEFGPVTLRRMFSGYGISCDGVNFAMALRDGLIFRADERTIARFAAEGAKPFQYRTKTKTVVVKSYWHVPERLYDDAEELADWAREALAAARRNAAKKKPARKTKSGPAKERPTKTRPAEISSMKRSVAERTKTPGRPKAPAGRRSRQAT